MKKAKFISIRSKLVFLLSLSASIALLVSSVAVFLHTYDHLKIMSKTSISNTAQILAENLMAPIEFGDPDSAILLLNTLKINSIIDGAFIIDAKNEEFASFVNKNKEKAVIKAKLNSLYKVKDTKKFIDFIDSDNIIVSVPMLSDNKYIASFSIIASTNDLNKSVQNQLIVQLIVFILSLIIIILLATKLQKIFTRPIFALKDAMGEVTENSNYKVHVKNNSNDEFGVLIDGFNTMIDTIENQTAAVYKAKKELELIHKHTRESIEYAAIIQSSLIPDNNLFRKYFQEYFVMWHPKDTVGGDIYFFNELRNDDECLILCIDCTGHGVPGAFVTMLVKAVESELIAEIFNNPDMEISTAWVMGFFNNQLKKLLKQDNLNSISNVGWDGSVFYYNKKLKVIKFSGAESPFFYRKPDGKIVTVKGTRKSVGYKQCPFDYKYKETVIENVEEGTKVFLTTDGYLDQNGGEKGFPFGKKRFIQIIEDYGAESMPDLQEMFMYEMAEWEDQVENNDRNDDMTVIGFTI